MTQITKDKDGNEVHIPMSDVMEFATDKVEDFAEQNRAMTPHLSASVQEIVNFLRDPVLTPNA